MITMKKMEVVVVVALRKWTVTPERAVVVILPCHLLPHPRNTIVEGVTRTVNTPTPGRLAPTAAISPLDRVVRTQVVNTPARLTLVEVAILT